MAWPAVNFIYRRLFYWSDTMSHLRSFIFLFLLFFPFSSYAQQLTASAVLRACSTPAGQVQCIPEPVNGYLLAHSETIPNGPNTYTAHLYCIPELNGVPYKTIIDVVVNLSVGGRGTCVYEYPPVCQSGPAGTHSWPASGNLTCIGQCAVTQTGDSTCTGTPAEGGICTATFDFTGAACPDEGDGGGDGGSSSSGGASSGGQSSSSGDGGDGGDGGDNGGGDSSSGSGSSGGSASSSGNGGVCPPGQISQGTLNGNAICVGQCPTGQYWGGVNGVYGCYGGDGSSAGSGSSDGTGECDPKSKDYAKCIGQINDVDDGLSDQIVGDATGEAETRLNEAYDALTEDVENFSGIDNEFSGAPNQLMSALQGFLPAPVGCSNIPLTFMGYTASLDCNLFNDFKLAFGWFLSILTAVYIWSLATKPVER